MLSTGPDLEVLVKLPRFVSVKAAPWIIGIAGFLALRLVSKARSLQQYKISLDGLPRVEVVQGQARINWALLLQNPTDEKLTVERVAGTVEVNGLTVATFETSGEVVLIQPRQTVSIPFSFVLGLSPVTLAVIDALSRGTRGTALRVFGTIRLHGLNIPFDVVKNITI